MSLSAARVQLSRNESLAAIIEAAESGDVTALLVLMKGGDYCSQGFREPPPECRASQYVEGVYIEGQERPVLGPKAKVEAALKAILSQQPVRLEFASRDSRYPEGNGGKYYLFFRAAKAATVDGALFNGVGIHVVPGEPQPISWVRFSSPQSNGLTWVQVLGGEDGAKYQILITPESVKDWPGVWGEKGD